MGWREGNTGTGDTRGCPRSGGVRDQRMGGHVPRGNRDTPERCLPMNLGSEAEVAGKADRRNPVAGADGESDDNIVPKKSANKGRQCPAEWMEGRASAEGNPPHETTDRMQDRKEVLVGLGRVRQRAEEDKQSEFANLFHFLKVPLLREAYYALKRNASPGLDGVNWHQYGRGLEARLPALQDELHRGSYRATPAKRTYLIKPDGRKRPLGMQAIEDKVVQMACVMVLNEVYEPSFSGFSYGSRPRRKPHDALDALHEGICRKKINWILDCDIEGFFDHLPHEPLMEIIGRRVKDRRLLRLIRKWLRVGWVEDGQRYPARVGTPQGAVISPLLANIYLDEVMDKWMSTWRREHATGDVIAIRYVDDTVYGFEHESEARSFLKQLGERLAEHGLKLHPGKTRLLEFGRFAASNRKKREQGKPESFDFLGFTHLCGKSRKGKFIVRRKTVAKRMSRKLQELKKELRRRMHEPVWKTGRWLASVIGGATRYYGIPGNTKAIRAFYTQASRLWLFAIRRRSQKARQRWTWERFYRLQRIWLPRPRICHPYPNQRFDAKHPRQEPYAVVPHVRICAGRACA